MPVPLLPPPSLLPPPLPPPVLPPSFRCRHLRVSTARRGPSDIFGVL